ncbi:acetylglutamate kinase [Leptospira sp. GIMC2001]|uniref:acetylglutamate kinase n=1 Tax=Leptospira sp. GIMC2001 TaxID=1513297 RepID=UPI00234BE246|nr:acetylglutamate kinase [Leptospira sp. GIMC2001]WCL47552.1 acetylglutamate kinase [Leptospira sp. GIMC2001]
MESQIEKVNHILEALPYITKFNGKTIVIKYGGAAMIKEELKASFAQDIVLLKYLGIHPVVVHGGGPEINSLLKALNIQSEFIRGNRVTTQETMDVVEMVLTGRVNKQIVSLINGKGGKAVGISGKDGKLALAEKLPMIVDGVELDLGFVGKVTQVDTSLIENLRKENFIPVISPIAYSAEGHSMNINADTMAGAIAGALNAEKLILLTDTEGILVNGKLVTGLNKKRVQDYIDSGDITGGMIPKVECCLDAINNGVRRTHIIDGRVAHSVLMEIFTDTGVGSLIE